MMEHIMRKAITVLALSACAVFLVGCATLSIQAEFRAARQRHEEPLRIEIGRDTEGVSPVRIRGGQLGRAVLSGQAEHNVSGGWRIDLLGMDWFNNWNDGWTDARFVISGSFTLMAQGTDWRAVVTEKPEINAPSRASIRYYDDYLSGSNALDQLTRRWNRIQAYAAFLRSRFDAQWFADQNRVRRFLFPELYGYERPAPSHHAIVTADSIAWNTDYTRETFPDNLRPLRDSATMLRDFEESEELWELAFHWDGFWSDEITAAVFHSSRQ
jgi:hypothetical protein